MEINNDVDNIIDDAIDEEADDYSEDDEHILFAKKHKLSKEILQRLKENDPSITHLRVQLDCNNTGEYVFNDIDWIKDGDCIINNSQLEMIEVYAQNNYRRYTLGEEGHNLPTRQQLQDFFSCICQNHSIKIINFHSIRIGDEFGGGLIEGLQGHSSLERFQSLYGRMGSIGCRALGKVLNDPKSKLKDLQMQYCLDDHAIQALSEILIGNSSVKRLDLSGNIITPAGWRVLSTVIRHPNCKLIALGLHATGFNDE